MRLSGKLSRKRADRLAPGTRLPANEVVVLQPYGSLFRSRARAGVTAPGLG